MLRSNFVELTPVKLPYQARQMYMHSFDLGDPKMAPGYEDYLGPVTSLCRAAGALTGVAHMTVDEKIVDADQSQRRPGPHVDGCFMPQAQIWGHDPSPGWLHYCNHIRGQSVERMAVIVASSVSGCRAWRGQFDAEPNERGGLEHIADRLGAGEILPPNIGFLLSPDCVHESMVFDRPTERTFLRIALPVWRRKS